MHMTVANGTLGRSSSSLQPTRILTWAAIIRVKLTARSSSRHANSKRQSPDAPPCRRRFSKAKPGIRTLTPMKSPTADRAILSRFGLQLPSAGFREAPHTQAQTSKVFFFFESVTAAARYHGMHVWTPPGRGDCVNSWYMVVPRTVHVARGGFHAASGCLPFDACQKTMSFLGGAEPRALSSRDCWRNPPPHGLSPDQPKGGGRRGIAIKKKPRLLVSATRREGRAGGGAKGPTSRRIERVQRQGTGDDFRPGPPGGGGGLGRGSWADQKRVPVLRAASLPARKSYP